MVGIIGESFLTGPQILVVSAASWASPLENLPAAARLARDGHWARAKSKGAEMSNGEIAYPLRKRSFLRQSWGGRSRRAIGDYLRCSRSKAAD